MCERFWTLPTAPLTDPEFGVSMVALHLVRIAEMYQWEEQQSEETRKSVGGSEETVTTYTYRKVWSEQTIDSQSFRQRTNHINPPKKYSGFNATANDSTLGAFHLDAAVLDLLPTNAVLRVAPETAAVVAPRIPNAKVIDGQIYIGADPANPQIGDYRISYVVATVGPISVIGRQTGAGVTQYQTAAGKRLLMAVSGTQAATDMFKDAEEINRLGTWLIRIAGMVLMWLGAFLVLRPLVVVADVVPLIGNVLGAGAGLVALAFTVVLAPVVMAIAWLWYRPLVSLAVLAVGLAVGVGLHRLAGRRSAARTSAASA
jgi:Transmembrane protein 43